MKMRYARGLNVLFLIFAGSLILNFSLSAMDKKDEKSDEKGQTVEKVVVEEGESLRSKLPKTCFICGDEFKNDDICAVWPCKHIVCHRKCGEKERYYGSGQGVVGCKYGKEKNCGYYVPPKKLMFDRYDRLGALTKNLKALSVDKTVTALKNLFVGGKVDNFDCLFCSDDHIEKTVLVFSYSWISGLLLERVKGYEFFCGYFQSIIASEDRQKFSFLIPDLSADLYNTVWSCFLLTQGSFGVERATEIGYMVDEVVSVFIKEYPITNVKAYKTFMLNLLKVVGCSEGWRFDKAKRYIEDFELKPYDKHEDKSCVLKKIYEDKNVTNWLESYKLKPWEMKREEKVVINEDEE